MGSSRGKAGGPGKDDKESRPAQPPEDASTQTPGDRTRDEAPEHGESIQAGPGQAAEETANPSPETAGQAGPAEREEVQRETRSAERQAETNPPPFARARHLPIVAVGASAGGLEALQAFFAQVPEDSGIGFVVITHVRPQRESLLPELLASATKLQVVSGESQVRVEPDQIVVAKDSLLGIHNGVLTFLDADRDPETKHHPIDHFFRDLARDQGEQSIGIVLSGSGNDGTLGAKAIKAAGGMVMAQRPGSAKYASMPSSVIDTGVADYVMPAEDLPTALVAYCHGPFLRLGRGQRAPLLPEDTVRTILLRLRARTGHDFTCYKKSTVSRRIQRRMNVHQIEEPQGYLRYLQTDSAELDLLLQDLLISVTSFFRDAEAFVALAERGLPRLLSERKDGELLRVWVAGCATGEEAYSVAILLDAGIREAGRVHEVQLFATDLDAQAIDIARHGLYPEGIAADVPPERLKQYFTPEDSAYRIRKSIRDTIVFAVQNVVSDPPFTRMDLVVCRNLLIYLDNEGQQRVLPTLHYALRPGGLLFLGSSESVGAATDLFEVIDGKHKILRRRDVPRTLPARRTRPPRPVPARDAHWRGPSSTCSYSASPPAAC